MSNLRISACEIGPISHYPTTTLQPARRHCLRGHDVPRYGSSRVCVACAKLHAYGYKPNQGRRAILRRFADLAEARAAHEARGGWLLDLGGGMYGVTDNLGMVQRRRGRAWIDRCDRLECWDETQLRLAAAA